MAGKEAERESLLAELQKAREALSRNGCELESHSKEDHVGWPVTSCHACMNFQQNILAIRVVIERKERELGA